MGQMPVAQLAPSFPPFVLFREQLGFVPNLFCVQTLVPRLLEAEASLIDTLLFSESALSRVQKEYILTAVSASQGNAYGAGWHTQTLRLSGVAEEQARAVATDFRTASLPSAETSLLRFAVKLGAFGPLVSIRDIEALRAAGFSSDAVLDAILLTALAIFLCRLAATLNPKPDFAPWTLPLGRPETLLEDEPEVIEDSPSPYLAAAGSPPEFDAIRQVLGFVPNLYRSLASRPAVLRAEVDLIRLVLLDHSLLAREWKELLGMAVSAANANTYCVALQGEILRVLGVPIEIADQAAGKQPVADTLPDLERGLIEFGRRRADAADLEALWRLGLTNEQILEAIVTTALANFQNAVQNGLGTLPDVPPRHFYRPAPMKIAHPPSPQPHQQVRGPVETDDPDVAFVEAAQEGDMNAFEELVNRHTRRVYRTLAAILGDPEEARDATQDTFLKVFNSVSSFEGRSKFSTWLLTVAANSGLQRLRERKPMESLDAPASESDEDFRPRQVQAWSDNPEQHYAKLEMQRLVEQEVRKLPAKYRLVVVLRDIEQISTEEAASVLGLGVPALKARLLRARLMLREALTRHFSEAAAGARR